MVGQPRIHGKQEIASPPDQPTRLLSEWWIIAAATMLAAILLTYYQTTRPLDSLLLDALKSYDAPAPDPRILLVTIDDESLHKIGPWPWPRTTHAQLIGTLASGRPKAIGYDVLFAEPMTGDTELTRALAGPAPVFLPLGFDIPGHNGHSFDLIRPPADLMRAAAGIGHVNLTADSDSVVRRVRLWDGDEATRIPQLMLLLSQSITGEAASASTSARSMTPRIIPFARTAGFYPSVSASAVLHGELPPEVVRNRILLVGATATGLNDWHPTSAYGRNGTISGVELQASLLDALLHNRLMRDGTLLERILISLLPPFLLLVALRRLMPHTLLVTILVIVIADLLLCGVALTLWRIWLSPVTGIMLLAILYPLWGWRRLAAVSRFMISELEQLQASNPLSLQPAPRPSSVDPVTRQLILLRGTAAAMRDIQRQRESLLQFLTHDMRAPQSSIVAALRTASREDISPRLSERIEGYAQRTLDLAEGFVHLARADSLAYQTDSIDLSSIVLDAIDDVWPLLQQKRLSCEARYDETGSFVADGDAGLLFRVVVNILQNAIRHSPIAGEISCVLGIATIDGIEMVVCAIADDGPGVPVEKRPLLFGRFASSDGSRGGQPSVGLGLAFAATVIGRHGGHIWYEPDPKTTFRLALPRSSPTPPA